MTLNENNLEKRFQDVSISQGSIQSLSFFCLHYKNHHKKIAQVWLRCLQKSKVNHRLTLIYLANDIVQNAKRKNIQPFIDAFKSTLKDAIPFLRDEKIKKSVERVFNIWQDRAIFDTKYSTELKNLLNGGSRSQAEQPKTHTPASRQHEQSSGQSNAILDCLSKVADNKKNIDELKSKVIFDDSDHDVFSARENVNIEDLKNYINLMRDDIDVRTKLSKLLGESINDQKKLILDSENQITLYKSQMETIVRMRNELDSNH